VALCALCIAAIGSEVIFLAAIRFLIFGFFASMRLKYLANGQKSTNINGDNSDKR